MEITEQNFRRLREYLNAMTLEQQEDYARRCDTTIGYLRKALYTHPRFDGALCRKLDEESGGAVPRASLRPDIWPFENESTREQTA